MKKLAIVALVTALTACSGGTQTSSPVVPPVSGGSASSSRAALTIVVPSANAVAKARLRPAYVSPGTQSLSIAVAGGAAQLFAISASAPGCVAASGTLTCNVSVSAPVGTNEAFVISTFANAAGTGTPLSQATVMSNVVAGAVNPLTVTLNGVVASIAVALNPTTLTPGSTSPVQVAVNALDASGNTIVGPGSYVDANGNPVTIALADSDSTYTALSATTVTQPTSGITLSYTGCGNENATVKLKVTATSGSIAQTPGTATIAKSQFLYVSDFSASTVTEYPVCASGNTAPTRTLSPQFAGFLGPVAVDANGYLYISISQTNGTAGSVIVFPPKANGAASPVRVITESSFNPSGLAIDDARGELYVYDAANAAVDVFATGATPANGSPILRSIAGSNTLITNGYQQQNSLAFDPVNGQITLGNSGNKFLVFAQCYALPSCNEAPVRSLTFYPYFPVGSAIDPATENYYEVNDGESFNVFSPTAMGADQPFESVAVSSSGPLPYPAGLALDAASDAYVSNTTGPGTGSIVVFAPAQTGNVVPLRTLSGTATNLSNPGNIAIGP